MKFLKYSLICLLAMAGFSSCEKDGFVPLTDTRPAIPVIVTNSTDLRPGYTVRVLQSDGNFKFDLEIPASSGRTIKEITSIVAGSGSSRFFGRTPITEFVYINAPIPGNGNKVSFSTSITEYTSKTGAGIPNFGTAAQVELTNPFYFLITLDDNSTIVSEQVRVLVIKS